MTVPTAEDRLRALFADLGFVPITDAERSRVETSIRKVSRGVAEKLAAAEPCENWVLTTGEILEIRVALSEGADALTREQAALAEVERLRDRIAEEASQAGKWDAALRQRAEAAEAKVKHLAEYTCRDCMPNGYKEGEAIFPCVRHNGCEHGFPPETAFFMGWDETWEHQRKRAEHAEAKLRDAQQREAQLAQGVRDVLGIYGLNDTECGDNLRSMMTRLGLDAEEGK